MYISFTYDNEPSYSEGFAVRFYPPDGPSWVGNFQNGWGRLNAVIELPNEKILVVAGGLGYLITIWSKNLERKIHGNFNEIVKTSNSKNVLVGGSDFTVIEPTGEIWTSDAIGIDGLNVIKSEGDIIHGLWFDCKGSWLPFSYDLRKRTILDTIDNPSQSLAIVEKPWWKFW